MRVTVIGGGPAGSSAAITAMRQGTPVELREKSQFPRHRVCGEFISPETVPLLEQLGVAQAFFDAKPASIRRLVIRFGVREKRAILREPAYGLSRFVFDKMLFERAREAGAELRSEPDTPVSGPVVVAHGRRSSGERGRRRFGFKAHFRGPSNDAIELHFFNEGYVGIVSIEDGLTNVCGLAAESALAPIGFDYDALLVNVPSVAARLGFLTRQIDWLTTGPLVFANRFDETPAPQHYYAGDALSFVDPFTGSGLYCAVLSGTIAGSSASRGSNASEHLRQCGQTLARPFAFASLFRNAITAGWAQRVAPFVPAPLLYRLTRP